MMLATASSTPRMISLTCSSENPSISINGASAPRITQSKPGWLRSSSFSKNARFHGNRFLVSRVCFAATGVMILTAPYGIVLHYIEVVKETYLFWLKDYWNGMETIDSCTVRTMLRLRPTN